MELSLNQIQADRVRHQALQYEDALVQSISEYKTQALTRTWQLDLLYPLQGRG